MNKIFLTSLALWAANIFKGLNQSPTSSININRLKMSLAYVKGIKTFRLMFISFLGVCVLLIFLLAGLILFNVTLFAYTSFIIQTKMVIGFSLTFLYLFISGWLFYYLFKQETWMSMFHTEEIMKEIAGKVNAEQVE